MSCFRRGLLLFCLLSLSCEGGPTSDWPAKGNDDENNPPSLADAGVASMRDAGTSGENPSTALDGGSDADVPDAGPDGGVRDAH